MIAFLLICIIVILGSFIASLIIVKKWTNYER